MEGKSLKVNRAPVMTLWAAIVAERLGYEWEEALSLGRGVAGLNAQSKGKRLGIYQPSKEEKEKPAEKGRERREEEEKEVFMVKLLGRPVPARKTDKGIRAVTEGRPLSGRSVQRYLEGKFGADFQEVREAMEELARSYEPDELEGKAYDLYEQFRPEIPEGKRGWGALGYLDLTKVRSLSK